MRRQYRIEMFEHHARFDGDFLARDIDLAFMAMERNLAFVSQALSDALVEARREVYS